MKLISARFFSVIQKFLLEEKNVEEEKIKSIDCIEFSQDVTDKKTNSPRFKGYLDVEGKLKLSLSFDYAMYTLNGAELVDFGQPQPKVDKIGMTVCRSWYGRSKLHTILSGFRLGQRVENIEKVKAKPGIPKVSELLKRQESEVVKYLPENKDLIFLGKHKYLDRKGVRQLFTKWGQNKHVLLCRDDSLLIPMFDFWTGDEKSYQRIFPNGEKKFKSGGSTKEAYFLISGKSIGTVLKDSPEKEIVLAEGYATALTAQEAMPAAEICCCFSLFGMGNIVKALSKAGRTNNVAVLMDTTKDGTTPPEVALKEAVKWLNIFPELRIVIPEKLTNNACGSDLNDLYCETKRLDTKDITMFLQNFGRKTADFKRKDKELPTINEFVYTLFPDFYKKFGTRSEFQVFWNRECTYVWRKDGQIVKYPKKWYIGEEEFIPELDRPFRIANYVNRYKKRERRAGVDVTVVGEIYRPGEGKVIDEHGEERLNTWRLPYYEEKLVCDLEHVKAFVDHIDYLCPDPKARDWFLGWIEKLLCSPKTIPTSAPLLINQHFGTGRGVLMEILCKLIGEWNSIATFKTNQFFSEFNSHFAERQLLCVEEFFFRGGRCYTHLKETVTARRMVINPKCDRQYVGKRTAWLLFSTNTPQCIDVPAEDRRLCCIFSDRKPKEVAYYNRLWELSEDKEFIKSLTYYFRNRKEIDEKLDISRCINYDINLFLPYSQDAVRKMAKMSETSRRGYDFRTIEGGFTFVEAQAESVPFDAVVAERLKKRDAVDAEEEAKDTEEIEKNQAIEETRESIEKREAETYATLTLGLGDHTYILLDFETASCADISKVGAHNYAEHESTEVLCCAYLIFNGADTETEISKFDIKLWEPGGEVPEVFRKKSTKFIAWNTEFEYNIWKNKWAIAGKVPDPSRWVDPMLHSTVLGFPRKLADACEVFELSDEASKSKAGNEVMKKVCLRHRKSYKEPTEQQIDELHDYCIQDIWATFNVMNNLLALGMDLDGVEHSLQAIHCRSNADGVRIDTDRVRAMLKKRDEIVEKAVERVAEISGGELNPRSNVQVLAFLKENTDEKVEDVTKETRDRLLNSEKVNDKVKSFLNELDTIKSVSLNKLEASLNIVNDKQEIRGLLKYFGAHTGRYSGQLLQIQNLPRCGGEEFDVEKAETLDDLKKGLRSIIIPRRGKKFIVVDYSAIEARVLAWMAAQSNVTEAFRRGEDVYINAAKVLTGKEKVEKGSVERTIGKVCTLGLGYGMGAKRLALQLQLNGVELEEDAVKDLHRRWRNANSKIVAYWSLTFSRFLAHIKDADTHLDLPSGRKIWYRGIETYEGDYGEEYRVKRPDKSAGVKNAYQKCYGGSLVENVVQATARDILAATLLKLENVLVGTDRVAFHVHDEFVIEINEKASERYVKKVIETIETPPEWAKGLPLAVEAHECNRYTK